LIAIRSIVYVKALAQFQNAAIRGDYPQDQYRKSSWRQESRRHDPAGIAAHLKVVTNTFV
jgi:hypothetical protein